jgi:hypothetical protein
VHSHSLVNEIKGRTSLRTLPKLVPHKAAAVTFGKGITFAFAQSDVVEPFNFWSCWSIFRICWVLGEIFCAALRIKRYFLPMRISAEQL